MSLTPRHVLPVILLLISNTFMTYAWYGHLKRPHTMVSAIVVSWLIAFGEYCFQVPANRIGYTMYSGYQLKIMQEAITLVVFIAFAWWYLDERLRWNHAVSLVLLAGAVAFAFLGRSDS